MVQRRLNDATSDFYFICLSLAQKERKKEKKKHHTGSRNWENIKRDLLSIKSNKSLKMKLSRVSVLDLKVKVRCFILGFLLLIVFLSQAASAMLLGQVEDRTFMA